MFPWPPDTIAAAHVSTIGLRPALGGLVQRLGWRSPKPQVGVRFPGPPLNRRAADLRRGRARMKLLCAPPTLTLRARAGPYRPARRCISDEAAPRESAFPGSASARWRRP